MAAGADALPEVVPAAALHAASPREVATTRSTVTVPNHPPPSQLARTLPPGRLRLPRRPTEMSLTQIRRPRLLGAPAPLLLGEVTLQP